MSKGNKKKLKMIVHCGSKCNYHDPHEQDKWEYGFEDN